MKRALALLLVALVPGVSPAQQDPVKERLEKSPRHHEWVTVKNGNREVHTFVVYP